MTWRLNVGREWRFDGSWVISDALEDFSSWTRSRRTKIESALAAQKQNTTAI